MAKLPETKPTSEQEEDAGSFFHRLYDVEPELARSCIDWVSCGRDVLALGCTCKLLKTLVITFDDAWAAKAKTEYGVESPDDLAPGPPRKAYDSYARPRDGEPTDDDVISKKAPLIAQQVAFLHRHEQARRNELLRNVDDATRALEAQQRPRHNVTVVLDNLRSAENVGSIFRTADAARVARIVTCGFTTTPPDRKLEKTALGAISSVPCEHFDATPSGTASSATR